MRRRRPSYRPPISLAPCAFCTKGNEPDYKEPEGLKPYVTDRGRLIARLQTGLCAKHQRRLTKAVKRARHLAFLPFLSERG